MPWAQLFMSLLPIILTPSHPHAQDAHAVLSDAHAAAAAPAPDHSKEIIDVLTRALDLQTKASAIAGSPLSPTAQLVAQALAGLVASK